MVPSARGTPLPKVDPSQPQTQVTRPYDYSQMGRVPAPTSSYDMPIQADPFSEISFGNPYSFPQSPFVSPSYSKAMMKAMVDPEYDPRFGPVK